MPVDKNAQLPDQWVNCGGEGMSQAIREMEQGGADDESVGKGPAGRRKKQKVGQARKGADQEQIGINYWKLPYARYVGLFKRRLSRR